MRKISRCKYTKYFFTNQTIYDWKNTKHYVCL